MIIYPMYANEEIIDDFYLQIVSGIIKTSSKTSETEGTQSNIEGRAGLLGILIGAGLNKNSDASRTVELIHEVTTSMKIKEIVDRIKDFNEEGIKPGSIAKKVISFKLNSCKTGVELANSGINILAPLIGTGNEVQQLMDVFNAMESALPTDELLYEDEKYTIIGRFNKKWIKSQEIDDIVSKEMHAIFIVKNIEHGQSIRFKNSVISKMIGTEKLKELKMEESVEQENETKTIIESNTIYDTELVAMYYESEF